MVNLADFFPNWNILRGILSVYIIYITGRICAAAMAGDIIFYGCRVAHLGCVVAQYGHKNTNAPLILKIWDIIFFLVLGKLHNGPFLGIFRGGLDFFDPKIAPRCAGPLEISLEMAHYV